MNTASIDIPEDVWEYWKSTRCMHQVLSEDGLQEIIRMVTTSNADEFTRRSIIMSLLVMPLPILLTLSDYKLNISHITSEPGTHSYSSNNY